MSWHLSADDVLYAFHDDSLVRGTGVVADIADLESSEIDRLQVDGTASIPRLEDLLLTWPQARFNIDTKSDATVLPLIQAIRTHRALDRVCVGSFIDRRIKKCRDELGPDLCTSMGRFEALRLTMAARGLADPSLLTAACAQLPPRAHIDVTTPALFELAHSLNIHVHVWTINEPDQMRTLVHQGADGIMTDRPRILRDVLIECGVWAPEGVLQ